MQPIDLGVELRQRLLVMDGRFDTAELPGDLVDRAPHLHRIVDRIRSGGAIDDVLERRPCCSEVGGHEFAFLLRVGRGEYVGQHRCRSVSGAHPVSVRIDGGRRAGQTVQLGLGGSPPLLCALRRLERPVLVIGCANGSVCELHGGLGMFGAVDEGQKGGLEGGEVA